MRGRGGGGVYYQRHGALKYGILQSFNPSVNNFPDIDKILGAGTKFNEFPEFGASRGNIKCLSTLLL